MVLMDMHQDNLHYFQDAVGTNAVTGDLMIVNAAAVTGTIIVECNKHEFTGAGLGWSA